MLEQPVQGAPASVIQCQEEWSKSRAPNLKRDAVILDRLVRAAGMERVWSEFADTVAPGHRAWELMVVNDVLFALKGSMHPSNWASLSTPVRWRRLTSIDIHCRKLIRLLKATPVEAALLPEFDAFAELITRPTPSPRTDQYDAGPQISANGSQTVPEQFLTPGEPPTSGNRSRTVSQSFLVASRAVAIIRDQAANVARQQRRTRTTQRGDRSQRLFCKLLVQRLSSRFSRVPFYTLAQLASIVLDDLHLTPSAVRDYVRVRKRAL